MTGTITLEADRIEVHEGVATAEGNVRLTWEDQALVGDRATLDGRTVTLTHGTWTRAGETLRFETAAVDVETREGALTELHVTIDGASLAADEVRLGPAGTWEVVGADLDPCLCADGGRPALSFRARAAELVPDRAVVIHGGTVRVFDVPVLPIPYWRVLLDRERFHLLFPELGYGEDGVAARWEGEGTVRGWTLRGGPAVLSERGVRGVASARGPLGTTSGELGWDWAEDRVRGIGIAKGGWVEPAPEGLPLVSEGRTSGPRVGWDLALSSDRAYADDYAVDYVARGVAWRESRLVGEWGPFRVLGQAPDDGSTGVLAQGRARWEIGRTRAVALAPRLEVALVEELAAVSGTGAVAQPSLVPGAMGRVGLDGRASGTLGPVHAELWGDVAAALQVPRGFAGLATAGEGRLELPLWGDLAGWRVQGWLGGRGVVDARFFEVEGIADDDAVSSDQEAVSAVFVAPLAEEGLVRLAAPPPPVVGGPSARLEAVGQPGTITADLLAGWSPDGFAPSGSLGVRTGPLQVDVHVDRQLQQVGAGVAAGFVGLTVGAARWDGDVVSAAGEGEPPNVARVDEDLLLAWGDLDLHPGRLRAGGGLTWDVEGAGFAGASARLGYDDGCSGALVTAAFAPDRAVPDFGFKLVLRR